MVFRLSRIAGIDAEQTRRIVAQLAEDYGRHPGMRYILAQHILRPAGVRTREPEPRARAIHAWVRDRTWFTPEAGEQIESPARSLAWRFADCDGFTALIGALLVAATIPWRPMLLARDEGDRLRPFHIWPQAHIGGRWVDLEACEPSARFGEHPIDVMARLRLTL